MEWFYWHCTGRKASCKWSSSVLLRYQTYVGRWVDTFMDIYNIFQGGALDGVTLHY